MAFYQDQDEEQQDPNAPQQAQTGPGSGIISGQGAATTSAAPAAVGAPGAPDNPGNFVGINQYLEANKSQAGKLGDNVVNKFNEQIDTTGQQIGQLGSQFQEKANQGTISNIDQAGADAARIAQQTASQSKDLIAQQKEADQARFNEVANAQYKGPSSLIETDIWQPAYQNLNKTQTYIGDTTEQGNKQLLRDMTTSPSYSPGQTSLDSLLLAGNEDSKAKLASARDTAKGLSGQFDAQSSQAGEYAKSLKEKSDAAKAAARGTLESTRGTRLSEVEDALSAVNKDWKSEYNKFLTLMKNSGGGTNFDLTPAEAARLGVSEGQAIYNTLKGIDANTADKDLNKLINIQAFDPNKVISQDEQAQLAALDELAALYGGTQLNKYTQADLAGTLNKQDALNTEGFSTAVKDADSGFKTDAKNKINTTAKDSRIGESGSYSGSMNDYLTGNYTKLPPVTKEDWKDIDRMFFGSYNGGGNAKAFMQIDLARKEAAYNAQQAWFKKINDLLNASGSSNKVK